METIKLRIIKARTVGASRKALLSLNKLRGSKLSAAVAAIQESVQNPITSVIGAIRAGELPIPEAAFTTLRAVVKPDMATLSKLQTRVLRKFYERGICTTKDLGEASRYVPALIDAKYLIRRADRNAIITPLGAAGIISPPKHPLKVSKTEITFDRADRLYAQEILWMAFCWNGDYNGRVATPIEQEIQDAVINGPLSTHALLESSLHLSCPETISRRIHSDKASAGLCRLPNMLIEFVQPSTFVKIAHVRFLSMPENDRHVARAEILSLLEKVVLPFETSVFQKFVLIQAIASTSHVAGRAVRS